MQRIHDSCLGLFADSRSQNSARRLDNPSRILLVGIVEVLIQDFRHLKHVDFIQAENFLHSIVADNEALVVGILERVRFDIVPYSLCSLWS